MVSEVGSVYIQIKKLCQKWDQFISRSRNGVRSGISLYPDKEIVSEVGSVCIQIKKWCQKWDQFVSRSRNGVRSGISLYPETEMMSGGGGQFISR